MAKLYGFVLSVGAAALAGCFLGAALAGWLAALLVGCAVAMAGYGLDLRSRGDYFGYRDAMASSVVVTIWALMAGFLAYFSVAR